MKLISVLLLLFQSTAFAMHLHYHENGSVSFQNGNGPIGPQIRSDIAQQVSQTQAGWAQLNMAQDASRTCVQNMPNFAAVVRDNVYPNVQNGFEAGRAMYGAEKLINDAQAAHDYAFRSIIAQGTAYQPNNSPLSNAYQESKANLQSSKTQLLDMQNAIKTADVTRIQHARNYESFVVSAKNPCKGCCSDTCNKDYSDKIVNSNPQYFDPTSISNGDASQFILNRQGRHTIIPIPFMCFTGDTPISMADGSIKQIQDVIIGDTVISCNLEDNGSCEKGRVREVFTHEVDHLIKLTLGNAIIKTTDHHPFYVVDDRIWVDAIDLKVGDRLQNIRDEVVLIEATEREEEHALVYNLDVESHHNYYACDILVHNCNVAVVTVLAIDTPVVVPVAVVGLGTYFGYNYIANSFIGKYIASWYNWAFSNPVEDILGEGATTKTNKDGDKIFISKDGKTKVRFDVKDPHGDDPHVHVEKQTPSGRWTDFFDVHRFYPKKDTP